MRVDDVEGLLSVPHRLSPKAMAPRLPADQRHPWAAMLRARTERGVWWLSLLAGVALVEFIAVSLLASPN